jgi:tetratricopeptide (TPR) repeat protein
MVNHEGENLHAILANLNAICEKRDRYEPFLDEIVRQWGGVSFSLSRVLILLARQQLQNCMLARMVDWYQAATGLPSGAVEFRASLEPPLAGVDTSQFARSCLAAALQLDPQNMYAAFLMGMAVEEAGDISAAAGWYEKSAAMRGYIGGVGLWLAARAFEKSGDLDAAERVYTAAEETRGHWRHIELVHLARLRMQEGKAQDALSLFGRAAVYDWQSLIDLFFDLPPQSDPTAIEVEQPLPCSVTPPVFDDTLRHRCDVYRWYEFYYAVPASLGPIRPIELTREGLDRTGPLGWRTKILAVFNALPRCYLSLRPLLLRVPGLAGVCRQFERGLTRSAISLTAMADGHSQPTMASRTVGFIDRDGYEYRIYRDQDMLFAVPIDLQGMSWHRPALQAKPALGALIPLALGRWSVLLKVCHRLSPRRFGRLIQDMLRERVISAPTLHELDVRFRFREASRQ